MPTVNGHLVAIFILFKMSSTRTVYITNPAALVEKIKLLLKEQYSLTASTNNSINLERRQNFNVYCKLLNDYDVIPKGHCPYLFDRITCWQSALPGAIVVQPCVTWPFEKTIPGQHVTRTCSANGSWDYDNSTEAFYAMYKRCTDNSESAAPIRQEDDPIMKLIVYSRLTALAGYVASMIALIVAIAIFVGLRKLHSRRNSIHLHCFISFFFRALLCVIETTMTVGRRSESDPCSSKDSSLMAADQCPLNSDYLENWPCKLLSLMWNFAFISNYFWILVEGFYLHNTIYFSAYQETRIILYVIFGWGTPMLVMIPWIVVKIIYDNTICWIAYCNWTFMWILSAPATFAICVNFIILCNIVRELYIKLSTDNQFSDQNRCRTLANAKSTFFLTMIFGVHHIVFYINPRIMNRDFSDVIFSSILVHCISVVVNSILGLVVACVYCFCDHEVRTELKKRWKAIDAAESEEQQPQLECHL